MTPAIPLSMYSPFEIGGQGNTPGLDGVSNKVFY